MTFYELASPNIVHEIFDSEAVILDLATGKYFAVSKSASIVFESLLDGVSLDKMFEALPADGNYTLSSVKTLTDYAVELAIFTSCERSKETELSADFLSNLNKAGDVLKVEVFNDLADLIIADPIHDVEKTAGWPVQKVN